MSRRHFNTTKLEIIQVATEMFIKKGYSNTSVKAIADELGLSTGHLTFYFPTKEHLLAVLVEMLCRFQWKELRQNVDEGKTSLLAICLELTAMASICETNEIAKDFYLSAYSNPIPLEIIRRNDTDRAKMVFADYCSDWDDNHFAEAETLVSGIEYATLMTTDDSAPLDVRIAGALNSIMLIYNVPEEIRKVKVDKVLSLDYVNIGKDMLDEFSEYVKIINEQTFEETINKRLTVSG